MIIWSLEIIPFSHGTGTLRYLQKEMATYRHWSVSLRRDPDDVSHCRILSPDKTEWRLISATLCGCGHCFVADQLWLMTRIREEEDSANTVTLCQVTLRCPWRNVFHITLCVRLCWWHDIELHVHQHIKWHWDVWMWRSSNSNVVKIRHFSHTHIFGQIQT